MSTTRSICRREPATEPVRWEESALIVVGHGSASCQAANTQLRRQAAEIDERSLFQETRAAALQGCPGPAEALAGLSAETAYLVPLFMSNGTFVRETVPLAFSRAGLMTKTTVRHLYLCPPVGLAEGLADLVEGRARRFAEGHGVAPDQAALLLIGHGSASDPASWQATEQQAARLRTKCSFQQVRTAYIDQQPGVGSALEGLAGPVLAMGLFAGGGRHADHDLPWMLALKGKDHIHYLGAIGSDPGLGELIIEQVAAFDRRFQTFESRPPIQKTVESESFR
ncbi:MAG TPA: CbiX/SirB N-terminal domain-containing protein [Rhodospirillales bacterium]|jgi:sirohydrochlorin cobaltochelatase|nr:CbiX/SirB N-terminal domain-containing protein [Rhodospirillales bacterium]